MHPKAIAESVGAVFFAVHHFSGSVIDDFTYHIVVGVVFALMEYAPRHTLHRSLVVVGVFDLAINYYLVFHFETSFSFSHTLTMAHVSSSQ